MDTGRYLFNLKTDSEEQIRESLLKKAEEFFKWYSNFQNRDPISRLSIHSSDFLCTKGCAIPVNSQISVIGVLYPEEDVSSMFYDLGVKYGLDVRISTEEGDDDADEIKFDI